MFKQDSIKSMFGYLIFVDDNVFRSKIEKKISWAELSVVSWNKYFKRSLRSYCSWNQNKYIQY